MKNKAYFYDRNIVTTPASFIAYFFYIKNEKALNIVLRDGKQYRYSKVPVQIFDSIMTAPNKSSYIAINIIHNKKRQSEFVGIVPQADVQKVTQPKRMDAFLAK